MLRELEAARCSGHECVKLIHGYGSSGAGGELRIALGRMLQEMRERGALTSVIYGEEWSITHGEAWSLIKRNPELKKDRDLGRNNRGITIVWF